jgi:hypothetical protein
MDASLAITAQASGRRRPPLRLGFHEQVLSVASPPSADGCFVEMMRCYRSRGGLAREVEVLSQLKHRRPRCDDGRSIHPGRSFLPIGFERAIRFAWGGWSWLPLFQFRLDDVTLREGPMRVVDALGPEFDGWDVAQWFTARNAWLRDQRPIDVIDNELVLVIEAARTDRFIAAG